MRNRRDVIYMGAILAGQGLVPAWADPERPGWPDAGWQSRWTSRLSQLERHSGGRLGVAMRETGTGIWLGWRDGDRFALCSTFKLLLAGWVLSLADQGKTALTQRIHYPTTAVLNYSPISGPHAGKDGMTVAELCAATVSWSDNTAANLLLQRHGGPQALTAFLRTLGDPVTRLDRLEPDLNSVAPGDVRDTTTPRAMLSSTERLVLGEALSSEARAHLRHWLRDCRTGDKRVRAGAPGWLVGDKTGSYEPDGIASDVAVLWSPRQEAPILISCYLERASGGGAERDAIVAEVARTLLAARAELRVS